MLVSSQLDSILEGVYYELWNWYAIVKCVSSTVTIQARNLQAKDLVRKYLSFHEASLKLTGSYLSLPTYMVVDYYSHVLCNSQARNQ